MSLKMVFKKLLGEQSGDDSYHALTENLQLMSEVRNGVALAEYRHPD
jgi:hypothetical protein